VSAGDVILFHRKTFSPMTALIHLTTRSKWNHAALDIGDGMMVEATSSGVRVNPIASEDEIVKVGLPLVVANLPADEVAEMDKCPCGLWGYAGHDLEEVLAWSTGRVGWKYGTLNAFWSGLRHLLPGMAHIKHGKTIICSELVAEALARAGHDWGKDYALVSPGDLAEHFGVPR
jgi:hypothetical protein